MPFPENEPGDDLTATGLTSDEIRTLYYAQEPMMQSIVDTTSQLSLHSRRVALALILTLAVMDTEAGAQEILPPAISLTRAQ